MTSPTRSSRRRGSSLPSSLVPAPLEDDNLLHEILHRLPPQPPYLLHASLVCKRWRRLATDSHFLGRFRLYHRRPPLLGVFTRHDDATCSFQSTLDPPSYIPPERFSLQLLDNRLLGWSLFDCRHGRLLLINVRKRQFIVWNPISDDRCLLAVRPEFHRILTGALLCAVDDQGHQHGGGCHSSPFKVALLGASGHGNQTFVSVYSSKTGAWGDLISKELTFTYMNSHISTNSTLVGNTLYWWTATGRCTWYSILAFDLERQCLAEIEKPAFSLREIKKSSCLEYYDKSVQIIQAKDGGLGFAALWLRGHTDYNETCLEMWESNKVNCSGVDTWVLSKSITINKILGNCTRRPRILHYVEDAHAIFLRVGRSSIFMVQLESMQSKELLLESNYTDTYHPFTSFYIC